jgi:aspartyl-tRNA(Asn)/glutamyl-tRNA(Gln) amidotransferase subunit B
LVERIQGKQYNAAIGKKYFAHMFETRKTLDDTVKELGLQVIFDREELERVAQAVIEKNPDNVAKYRAGNEGVFKFFVGQVMRETRGQANPQAVNEILKRLLSES